MGILDCSYKCKECDYRICSKKLHDAKHHKHMIKYEKSEGFFNLERSRTDKEVC